MRHNFQVGDWCYSAFSKKHCRILSISENDGGYYSVIVDKVDGVKDIASLSPIPLTPEILEKNGFQKEEVYGSLITKRFKRSWLTIETGGAIYRVIAINFFCTVRYVHQLQHALKHLEFEQEIVL